MMSHPLSRRRLLRATAGAGLGLAVSADLLAADAAHAAADPQAAQNAAPPSERRIRLGFIGVRNQGTNNLRAFFRQPAAQVVAVCDVDRDVLAKAKALVEKETGGGCAAYTDYRKLLESRDVDAVVITTPDHWHALQTIHACEAGKDVYCEKPLTLTIAEGRAMVDAARRHKRIVQTGSQQRSDDRFRQACEIVRSGRSARSRPFGSAFPALT
jgi:predicted dehydrogenase